VTFERAKNALTILIDEFFAVDAEVAAALVEVEDDFEVVEVMVERVLDLEELTELVVDVEEVAEISVDVVEDRDVVEETVEEAELELLEASTPATSVLLLAKTFPILFLK